MTKHILYFIFIFILFSTLAQAQPIVLPKDSSIFDSKDIIAHLNEMHSWYCPSDECNKKGDELAKSAKKLLTTDDVSCLIKNREKWQEEYLIYISKNFLDDISDYFYYVGKSFFILYPDLSVEKIEQKIQEVLIANKLPKFSFDMAHIVGLQKASDCPTKSLISPGSLLDQFGVTNQAYGTCYAHAGVKALDFFNHSAGFSKQRTSIIASAVGLNQSLRADASNIDDGISGGYSENIIKFLAEEGGCVSSELNSMDRYETKKILSNIELAHKQFLQAYKDLKPLPKSLLTGRVTEDAIREMISVMLDMGKKTSYFKKSTNLIFYKALGFNGKLPTNTSDAMEFTRAYVKLLNKFQNQAGTSGKMPFANYIIRKAYCDNKKIKYAPHNINTILSHYERYSPDWNKKFVIGVNKELSSTSAQPIITYMCSTVYRDSTYKGFKDSTGNRRSDCGPHALLLTGQRYDTSRKMCEYEFLNSWGNYGPDRINHPYSNFYKHNGRKGTVWIPSKQLQRNVYRAFHLKQNK